MSNNSNPFAQYNINSISVPMFYNHSNLSNVSSKFTNQIFNLLTQYKDLEVQSGYEKTDAVLVGVISSPDRLAQTIQDAGIRDAKVVAGSNIGESRGDFFVPAASSVQLQLRIFVIKEPTEKELKVMQSSFGKYIPKNSRLIFNENIALTGSFTREYFDKDGGQNTFTINRGALINAIDRMALNAANSFRDMILYAF